MIDEANIVYTFKQAFHISYNANYLCCLGSNVYVYNSKNGSLVSILKDIEHPCYAKFTSNDNLIIKTTTGKYHIYNLNSMALIRIIPPPPKVLGSTTDFQLTSDNKYIIDFSYVFPNCKLMFIETETGEYTFFDLECCKRGYVFSTEVESKYYLMANCVETINSADVSIQKFYELSYSSSGFKLEKLFVDNNGRVSIVDYGSNKIVFANYSNKITIFDIQKNYRESFEYTKSGVLYDLKISQNGQLVALAESKSIYIYDLLKKEIIRTFEVDYGCFVDFLDNDTKLLIGTWEKGFCVSL